MGIFDFRRTYDRLNQMLDEANNGTFSEGDYNETELSKLESKWKRFLGASVLSYEKIEKERTSLKSLVSDISHQTKTPLSNILLYSQILGERNLDEESHELVKRIEAQSEKLEFLIQALVKMSRLETETISLEPEIQKVYPMLSNVRISMEGKAVQKNIAIELEADDNITACFDAKWTEEALYNILDNAVKYSKADTTVSVLAKEYEMFVRIDIKDQGIGMNEEEMNRVFQRFYRGEGVQQEEGIGVGLYLTREIIRREKGYLKLSSCLGKGSCFSVFLKKD